MAIQFPAWVTAKIGVIIELEDGSLLVPEDADTDEIKYSEIIAAVEHPLLPTGVDVVQVDLVAAWRYAEVSIDGSVVCEIVEVPVTWGSGRPPSAIENLLIKAWCFEDQYDPAGLCERFANSVLVCWHVAENRLTVDAVLAVCGLSRRQEAPEFELPLRSKTRVSIGAGSSLITGNGQKIYAQLLQRALSETHVELRFLYFYRLFERAYLYNAFAQLAASFFADPGGALGAAEKTVANERLSFISLVEASGTVSSWFSLLEEEALSLATSNQFMIAIRRSCEKDKWLADRDAWKRGCSVSYKMRCAIVHAGERGPIFEEFGDAALACKTLLPYMEGAAIELLRLQTS